jgi:hypothetical protein
MVRMYEGLDIWKVVTRYFCYTKEMLSSATDPFGMFLLREHEKTLEKHKDYVMPLQRLLDIFKDWATTEEMDKKLIQGVRNNMEQIESALAVHKLSLVLVNPVNYDSILTKYKNCSEKKVTISKTDKTVYMVLGVRENTKYKQPEREDFVMEEEADV